jgi:hypothetical protein
VSLVAGLHAQRGGGIADVVGDGANRWSPPEVADVDRAVAPAVDTGPTLLEDLAAGAYLG